jgi:NADH-quinone oxidoreductase subunit K
MFKYIILSSILFLLGILGYLIVRKHVIMLLVSLELMLLSINMNLFIFSAYLDDIFGQFFSLFVLTVAAAESAVGLAILLVYYRLRGTIMVNIINLLKG